MRRDSKSFELLLLEDVVFERGLVGLLFGFGCGFRFIILGLF